MPFRLIRGTLWQSGAEAIGIDGVPSPAEGGGVRGAMLKAAGEAKMRAACEAARNRVVGESYATPGFKLGVRFVIHVTVPHWYGGNSGEAQLLYASYASALRMAVRLGVRSLAFTLLAAEVDFPPAQAATVAINAIGDFLLARDELEVSLVLGKAIPLTLPLSLQDDLTALLGVEPDPPSLFPRSVDGESAWLTSTVTPETPELQTRAPEGNCLRGAPATQAAPGATAPPETANAPASQADSGATAPPETANAPASQADSVATAPPETANAPATQADSGATALPETANAPATQADSGATAPPETANAPASRADSGVPTQAVGWWGRLMVSAGGLLRRHPADATPTGRVPSEHGKRPPAPPNAANPPARHAAQAPREHEDALFPPWGNDWEKAIGERPPAHRFAAKPTSRDTAKSAAPTPPDLLPPSEWRRLPAWEMPRPDALPKDTEASRGAPTAARDANPAEPAYGAQRMEEQPPLESWPRHTHSDAYRQPKAALQVPDLLLTPLTRAARSRTLSDAVAHLGDTFSQSVLSHIDGRRLSDVEVYKRANIDRKLFSKLRTDPRYRPSKVTALALCIALELNLDDARDLLAKAGYALSASNKMDVIVAYFIEHGNYNIFELNKALFAFGQPCLGA